MCRICIRVAEDPQIPNNVQLFDQNQHGGGGQNLPPLFNEEDYFTAPQDFSAKSSGYVQSMLKLCIHICFSVKVAYQMAIIVLEPVCCKKRQKKVQTKKLVWAIEDLQRL